MKFKMAPNSLFAVLLRSPWWISFGIAAGFAAVSHALLPDQFKTVGTLGGLPFAAIGVIALSRQWKAPSAKRAQAILDAVGRMGWQEFSCALETAFARDGYVVERMQAGPGDLLLRREGRSTLVSAKRWKAARHGEDNLQALHAAAKARDASGSLYVALGELSPNAQRLAKANGIQLMQGPALVQLLRDLKLPAQA
jgi:restriction system protein